MVIRSTNPHINNYKKDVVTTNITFFEIQILLRQYAFLSLLVTRVRLLWDVREDPPIPS